MSLPPHAQAIVDELLADPPPFSPAQKLILQRVWMCTQEAAPAA